jgi:hypothetical protein
MMRSLDRGRAMRRDREFRRRRAPIRRTDFNMASIERTTDAA